MTLTITFIDGIDCFGLVWFGLAWFGYVDVTKPQFGKEKENG